MSLERANVSRVSAADHDQVVFDRLPPVYETIKPFGGVKPSRIESIIACLGSKVKEKRVNASVDYVGGRSVIQFVKSGCGKFAVGKNALVALHGPPVQEPSQGYIGPHRWGIVHKRVSKISNPFVRIGKEIGRVIMRKDNILFETCRRPFPCGDNGNRPFSKTWIRGSGDIFTRVERHAMPDGEPAGHFKHIPFHSSGKDEIRMGHRYIHVALASSCANYYVLS